MVEKTLSAADLPRLVVQLPDGKEVHHSIAGTELTIGRDPSNRITIGDQFVSKFHAKLLVSHSSITLVDLGSANKTYVNGQPISELPVKYGDELQFAGVRCRLLGPESAERHAPPPAPPPPPRPAAPTHAPASAAPQPPRPPAPIPARKSAVPGRAKPPVAGAPAAAVGAAQPGRSTPPKIEADPMKRLLRIGGLLILVSLALAIMLRILLVPSGGSTPEPGKAQTSGTATATAAANPTPSPEPAPTTTTAPLRGGPTSSAQEYFDQALSYLDTGRLKEAETAFKKVLELEPDNASARTRLALLQEEITTKADQHFGNARQAFQYLRYDEAIAEWEMFLTLADSSDVRYAEAEQGIAQAKAKLR
jgi:FHA domain/Tetratricopeptide repeat